MQAQEPVIPDDVMRDVQKAQELKSKASQIHQKLQELYGDLNEHRRVISTLKEIEGTRSCFRMVGEVLVERTVEDVLPELEDTVSKLEDTVKGLEKDKTECDENSEQLLKAHGPLLEELGKQKALAVE